MLHDPVQHLFFALALLVSHEGFAVNALTYGRIAFVRADLNLIKRAVVCGLDVILAFRNGAGNTVVCCLVFHFE